MDDSLENINESSKPIPNAELFVYGTRKINVFQELNRYNRKKKGWDATYRSTINGITKLDRDLGRIYADAQVKFLKSIIEGILLFQIIILLQAKSLAVNSR